mgnify:CR=1 FL=1|tara:strand:+ start:979 stop:1182 length:204 start_codon:yes stop_codon:yes gene_type:complete
MKKNQSGSKLQRQNQHTRRLSSKIKKFKSKNIDTSGLEKELGYMMGEERPKFATGPDADPRKKKYGQ